MNNLTILIFGNQIFSEILSELKLFSEAKIKYYEDFSLCEKEFKKKDHLLIYFHSSKKENIDEILLKNTFPIIVVTNFPNSYYGDLTDYLNSPFNITLLKSKITALLAKFEFKKSIGKICFFAYVCVLYNCNY